MLAFDTTLNKRSQKALEKKPAWVDESDAKFNVDIDSKSRLRKLKQTEAEKVVDGDEYSKRLQEQYLKIQGEHSMFEWARQPSVINKNEDDSEEDPIADLLKTNTSIFS